MATVGQNMLVDQVDRNDRPVAVIRRGEVFQKRAGFRVAHILVFNSDGELLLQQLSSSRTRHPGYWGSSVAAYLFAGETYVAAAARRLPQELGIEGQPIAYVGKTSMLDDGARKFIAIFRTTFNGPFVFDPVHIERVEFLQLSTIQKLRVAGTRAFTPTFLRVLAFYEGRI